MTQVLTFHAADAIKRRAMFALELVDPVTGLLAGGDMIVRADGLRPPSLTRAGQLVWIDVDPPEQRQVAIEARAVHGQFTPYAATLTIPARSAGAPVLVERVMLEPTGLYEPPAGALAAAGMLLDTATARAPLAGVTVRLALRAKDDGALLVSELPGTTDARGGFVAVASDLGDETPMPMPPPAPEGGLVGWLVFTRQGATRHSALLPLRLGRLLRAATPFAWANLDPNPPPPP